MFDALWAVPLTIITFLAMRKLSFKLKYPIFNPLLLSIILIISLLLLLKIPYDRYFSGSHIIHQTLQIGVVSLAFPLYKQLP
ncbi:MAG: LrgB family protein, partial [Neisseriaceae bacterium]|nr:LrgB family protein [Neisseriaceae bacterium]